jgi:hypothetical protein
MEINKLIAEFMQKGSRSLGIYDFDGCHYRLDELKFHSSWDWLMTVIQKCRQENRLEYFDRVYYAIEECDINVTYKAVAEFIKNQNK